MQPVAELTFDILHAAMRGPFIIHIRIVTLVQERIVREGHVRIRIAADRGAIIGGRIDRARFAAHRRITGFLGEIISQVGDVLRRGSVAIIVIRKRAEVGGVREETIIVKSNPRRLAAAEGLC